LRKFLIAALAAVAALSFSAVAVGQAGDTAELTVNVTPKNAGTKKKPKNSAFDLEVVNSNTQRTMSALDIFLPKNVKLNLKGIPSCSRDNIALKSCPRASVLGEGTAEALAGVNGSAPLPLSFVVTAFKTKALDAQGNVSGRDMLGFFIDGPGSLDFLTETKLTKARGKYGQKLHIDVPVAAQRTGTSSYNGLVSLEIDDLGKKKGRNMLVSSTGCVKKKHPYKVDLTFIDNGVTTATTISDTATSGCRK
jgi:hypothetical protein